MPAIADRGAGGESSPMTALDEQFVAIAEANPGLRVRVGNPDELRSNKLDRTLDASTRNGAEATLQYAIRPALAEFAEEMRNRGMEAALEEGEQSDHQPACPTLRVDFEGAPPFIYAVKPLSMKPPSFLPADDDDYLRLDVHLSEGGIGQDLNGYTRQEVLHDILNEYQRHLHFLTDQQDQLETLPGMAHLGQPEPAEETPSAPVKM